MDEPASTRVDRWLWAVRVFKTRTEATDACRGGHVRVNGTPAKASTAVRPGDRVEVRGRAAAGASDSARRERDLEVTRIIDKRVGAPIAATCLIEHGPAVAPAATPPAFVRDRGSGRPTKRDRRELDRFRSS
jgi:ribosome-associated heat shock protein Hsp15